MFRDLKRALLATGMVLALGGFALAHDERGRGSDVAQRANQQGYSDGYQHGREDRDRGAGYDYQGDDYQRADRGYDPNYGDREQFVSAYREGYRAGYDDGYNGRNGRSDGDADDYGNGQYGRDNRSGRGGYGPNAGYGYNNAAYDTGYQDGIGGAQKDIRNNKRFDINRHSWYRDADHGYSSRYGSKDLYRQQYRQGYEAGYREFFDRSGYGGYGGYPNGGYPNGGYGKGRYGGGSDVAYATGYSDGMGGARKDVLERKSPDPTRHDWYRDANHGYDRHAYPNRDDYKQRYRQGFIAGYNHTYGAWRK